MNRFIRGLLRQIVREENRRQTARERITRFMREKRIEVGQGRWKRENLYERKQDWPVR
jgi:hypothetical protein